MGAGGWVGGAGGSLQTGRPVMASRRGLHSAAALRGGQGAAAYSRLPCAALAQQTQDARPACDEGAQSSPCNPPPPGCAAAPDLRSAPMMMRSLAYSRSPMPTARCPSRAALSAATLTRLARSAPLKPGVPLAMTCGSRRRPRGGRGVHVSGTERKCWQLQLGKAEVGRVQACQEAGQTSCSNLLVAVAAAPCPPPHPTHLEVHIRGARDLLKVDLQDLAAPLHVWVGHHHVAVKPARPHQRLVQRLGEVGGGDDNHACGGFGGHA